ncbi:MAG: ABC transporter permease [Chloroflexota bacterium]
MNKIFDIAIKDMTRSFRSAFALVFMFVIPLLIPLMFLAMFGSMQDDEQPFELSVTRVIIVNLDEGGLEFEQAMGGFPGAMQADSLGEIIVSVLQDPGFSELIAVTLAADPEAARLAVDNQEYGVAIIIPADFSARFSSLDEQAALEFYQDPTLSIGPGIVKSILNQFMDGFSGARIAVDVAISQTGGADPAVIGQVAQQYLVSRPQGDQTAALLEVRTPAATEESTNIMLAILAPMMGAMMVFYAYYTGVATSQSILSEDEAHTLPRLFTTPTPAAAILTGKFVGVFLTVSAQVLILVLASGLIFKIDWGEPAGIALLVTGVILNASSFGIFLNSLLKSTKQGGAIFGGVLTLTTMLGMLPIFTGMGGGDTRWSQVVASFFPQGWVMRLMLEAMSKASLDQMLNTALVILAWTVVFFVAGIWRFQRRYA